MITNVVFIGAVMAIILGSGQLLSARRGRRNWLAAGLLFCLGVIHLITYSQAAGFFAQLPVFIAIQIPMFTLLGPMFYLYFMYILNSGFKLARPHALHFLPTLLTTLILIPHLSLSSEQKAYVQLQYTSGETALWETFPNNLVVVIFISTLLYVLYPLKTVMQLFKHKMLRDNPTILVTIAFIGCFSVNLVAVIFNQFYHSETVTSGIAVFFTCWIIAMYLVNQKYPAFLTTVTDNIVQAKYQKSQLGSVSVEKVLAKLKLLMEEDKIFLDEDLSLPALADMLSISTHQLSEILNHNLNSSFKNYIKKIRIAESKKLLLANPNQTVLTISMEVGFRSCSTFNAAFKRETGLSPVEYRKTHLPT